MTATILRFPDHLGDLPRLGARLGVDLRWFAAPHRPDRLMAFVSTVGHEGALYTRVELEGFPTAHYRGELTTEDAAMAYWAQHGATVIRRIGQ